MTYNNETIVISEVSTDIDGNPRLTLNLTSPLAPQDVLVWEEEWSFTVLDRRPPLPQISIEQSGTVNDTQDFFEPDDFYWFTRETGLWKTIVCPS